MNDIKKLFKKYDNCPLCKASNNNLQHILGGGKKINPRVALIFINPTHTNISSNPNWKGRRFPFIGVTRFWQIFSDTGWVTKDVIENIKRNGWKESAATLLDDDLAKCGIYITNLIKCTFPHGDYPEKGYFNYHLPLFEKELSIVKPKAIISFGVLTTKHLTGESLVLKRYFDNHQPLEYGQVPVYPCYFPVGRGNPKLATGILKDLRSMII